MTSDTPPIPVPPTEPQPWSPPAPPAGMAWHRQDWTEEMLPEGYRPLLFDERWVIGDEIRRYGEKWEVAGANLDDMLNTFTTPTTSHCRTRRPLPVSQPDTNPLFTDPITYAFETTIDGKRVQICGSVGSQPEQASPGLGPPPPGEEPFWQAIMAEAKAKESTAGAKNPLFSGDAGPSQPPLARQEGGSHYARLAIQPVQFIHANKLSFLEGCVVKRLCRHRHKGGAEDIRKAIHELELILTLEYPESTTRHPNCPD